MDHWAVGIRVRCLAFGFYGIRFGDHGDGVSDSGFGVYVSQPTATREKGNNYAQKDKHTVHKETFNALADDLGLRLV